MWILDEDDDLSPDVVFMKEFTSAISVDITKQDQNMTKANAALLKFQTEIQSSKSRIQGEIDDIQKEKEETLLRYNKLLLQLDEEMKLKVIDLQEMEGMCVEAIKIKSESVKNAKQKRKDEIKSNFQTLFQ